MAASTFEEILKSTAMEKEPTPQDAGENNFSIYKTDDDKRLVFGWASVAIKVDGEQLEDRQKDIIDPEDLEEAAYEYVLNFRDTGEEHIRSMRKKGKLVESCVFTEEKQKAMGIPPGTLPVAWWIGFKIEDDAAWARVKNGTYKMFSIEGKANRIPVEKHNDNHDPATGRFAPKGSGGGGIVPAGKIESVRSAIAELPGTDYFGRPKESQDGAPTKMCQNPVPHCGKELDDAVYNKLKSEREADRDPWDNEHSSIETLKVSELTTQQPVVDRKNMEAIMDSGKSEFTGFMNKPDEINIVRMDGKYVIVDGNHRSALAKLAGNDTIKARVYDADNRTAKKSDPVAKTFEDVLKFNPFHDAKGRFASSNSFAFYSANPKTKAGAMAISRSAQAGHGTTFNSHKESQGENINQNYAWLNGGPGAKQLSSQGQLASQQPKTPPKPQKNYDSKGFADYDDADYHQLYNRKQYFQQQQLTTAQKKAADAYVDPNTEPGSLYNVAQNVNWQMVQGQTLTGKHKQVHDEMMGAMHNIGYNVTLTRYDHAGMIDNVLSGLGAGNDYTRMSMKQIQKALVGQTLGENKFISTTTNDFKNAPGNVQSLFTDRAVKINYKAKAGVQGLLMPIGSGGDQGELVLAPTNGKGNSAPRITAVRSTGKTVYRAKNGRSYPQIEIDLEWD